MSGGSHGYIYYEIESQLCGAMHDRELNDLMKDIAELAHDLEWVEKRLDVTIQGNTEQDVYDFIKESTPKKQRTTLQEQKQAKAGLEAFRAWTADNTG